MYLGRGGKAQIAPRPFRCDLSRDLGFLRTTLIARALESDPRVGCPQGAIALRLDVQVAVLIRLHFDVVLPTRCTRNPNKDMILSRNEIGQYYPIETTDPILDEDNGLLVSGRHKESAAPHGLSLSVELAMLALVVGP